MIYFHGVIFTKKILKLENNQNFYEISLIGLIITIVLAQMVNFLIPLSDYLLISNIIVLIIYLIFNPKILKDNFKINKKILILVTIISVVSIYGSGFSDDIDHYHYGFISNADKTNFIWGYSFLHPLYSTSPSWLIGHSYLNFEYSRLQDIHILNGIILFLILGLFLSELSIKKNKDNFYNPFIFSLIIFILIKYTRLKEFGIDRPSVLIFCFLIYYYLKYFLNNNEELLKNFIILSLISIFIISIKIIHLPILILPLFVFFKFKKKLIKLDLKYLIIILAILVFALKNLLGTGCLLFPLEFSCIKFLSWSNFEGAKEFTIFSEAINKSWWQYTGELTREEYIKNFSWFNTWFQRGKIEILELFLTIALIIFFSFISYNLKTNKSYLPNNHFKDLGKILVFIILSSIFIYFMKNPVIRMNHHTLLSLMILIILLTFKFDKKKYNKNYIYIFLIIGLIFNFSKNIIRISNNDFINDPKLMISQKINPPEKKNLGSFTYYMGWYGNTPIGNQYIDNNNYRRMLIFDIIEK